MKTLFKQGFYPINEFPMTSSEYKKDIKSRNKIMNNNFKSTNNTTRNFSNKVGRNVLQFRNNC